MISVYSGIKLAKILTQVLDKYGITNQISTLTTDNASNNKTLNKELNELVSLIESGQNILGRPVFTQPITRIPCMAHILQLALKALLGGIQITPTNEELLKNWHQDDTLEFEEFRDRCNDNTNSIPWTIAKVSLYSNPYSNPYNYTNFIKVRALSRFTNASSQRRERFDQIQREFIGSNRLKQILRLL